MPSRLPAKRISKMARSGWVFWGETERVSHGRGHPNHLEPEQAEHFA
jgi:hypothetical protein